MSEELYNDIVKFSQQYSHSVTTGTRVLLRSKLNDIARSKGLFTPIEVEPTLLIELKSIAPEGQLIADFIRNVLWNYVNYRNKAAKANQKDYYDERIEKPENFNQEASETTSEIDIESELKNIKFEKEKYFDITKYTLHNNPPKSQVAKIAWLNQKKAVDNTIKLMWLEFQKQ